MVDDADPAGLEELGHVHSSVWDAAHRPDSPYKVPNEDRVEMTGCMHYAHGRDIEAAAPVDNQVEDSCLGSCLADRIVLLFAFGLQMDSYRSLTRFRLFARLYHTLVLSHHVLFHLHDLGLGIHTVRTVLENNRCNWPEGVEVVEGM